MPMEMGIQQLPVATRIPALAECVRRTRNVKDAAIKDEAEWLDQLALAEAEGAALGIPPSGLIEANPYLAGTLTAPAAPEGTQGDAVDPNTGESHGGA